ncbi:glycoside hydrolase family 31 protein [Streptomyces thermolineatus]|uniref:glycoside hydrolase family 31 protein n=1 Tax=Streptomyces thermolineatus TaxID=44033 RepID=UPI00384F66BE
MDVRGLVRAARWAGPVDGVRVWSASWRRHRSDVRDLPPGGPARARVPGGALGAEPGPGGGTVRFARSRLLVRVFVGGAVFCGWDGAEPGPSYALGGELPEADVRAVLEPDQDGWRLVSERTTVLVSRQGAVEFRTPGGVLLRRDLPPRWWDRAGSGAGDARWVQRSELPADARFFGLGGRARGAGLPAGAYRLWSTGRGGWPSSGERPLPGGEPGHPAVPVHTVVSDAGCHMVLHDCSREGLLTLHDGAEGAGSGHDRPAGCELTADGGPLRYWVLTGPPARLTRGWVALTGAPALPPLWALGHHHRRRGARDVREVIGTVEGHRGHGLPLAAVHLGPEHLEEGRAFTVDGKRFPGLRGFGAGAGGEAGEGVRLVSAVVPAVRAGAGCPVYEEGSAADAFVRDARGTVVRGAAPPGGTGRRGGGVVWPDFTDAAVRHWWGGLYGGLLEQGFSGVWHEGDEPWAAGAFGERTLPRSARHSLEGRGGDHREAHNVYGLQMARAAHRGLRGLRPGVRPFLVPGAGWAGVHRYGPVRVGGAGADWEGLRGSLSALLGLGLSGVPLAGADVPALPERGGAELFVRWMQLGSLLPFLRTCSGADAADPWRPGAEPWRFGAGALAAVREAFARREELMPYLYTVAHTAHRAGVPWVRPVWWHEPEDRALREVGDAFLVGGSLLVAPVTEPGAVSREVRLPRGRWYDRATGAVYRGPGRAVVRTPLSRLPVLVRAGAVLPVAAAGGGVELEVWAPEPGRRGMGLLIRDGGDGWDAPVVERFTSRLVDGRVLVVREGADGEDGAAGAGYPVRVCGAPLPE